ncbi:tyrosine-type recombinase/integrase [Sedimentibacter hydroxybenzoicus DSM 7310]|uniref:Tyrosine-type recombinase/integrase n=1 Tax=Sedimentibacter hydroxybenzoicus DSM 7310 TaxID=1123245 RepID=A0A974GVL9_SEDHY|nr:tyrosine-type recombinase/integrase [Sedimentibacter hydroxybenzoicus]NYB73494.1 tyrosine-type recombinase/integrase [Sedimentibacter hydroxybenzoicus DSM 7310]
MKEKITLKKAIEQFPSYLNIKGLKDSTIGAYKIDILIFENYIKEKYPSICYIDSIGKAHIMNYRNFLTEKITTKEYKKSTVDRKYDSLKVFYDFLEEFGFIEDNFVKDFSFKRVRNQIFDEEKTLNLPKYLDEEDIKKIVETAKKDRTQNNIRDIAILEFLRSTGCRRSSVLALNWEDIDFVRDIITIKHSKTDNVSIVPLSKSLRQALIDYLAIENRISGKVFKIGKDALNDLVKKYVRNSGVQDKADFNITIHTFRHSFITNLVRKNVSLKKIAQYTGHKDIRTLEIYTHLIPTNLNDVCELIG